MSFLVGKFPSEDFLCQFVRENSFICKRFIGINPLFGDLFGSGDFCLGGSHCVGNSSLCGWHSLGGIHSLCIDDSFGGDFVVYDGQWMPLTGHIINATFVLELILWWQKFC